jgi:hypothetical protein
MDVDVLKFRRAELELEGWSVASYTWNKLNRLSENGALFIQHLKLESKVIRDDRGRLARLLNTFRPKENYDKEISRNASLASVALSYPSCNRGALWAADVLYICLRNFGILYLANMRKYTFAFNSILNDLVDCGCLLEEQANVLRQLRSMKSLYRNGSTIPFARAREILDEAAAAMPRGALSERCSPVAPKDVVVLAAKNSYAGLCSYGCLRNLEKIYVALIEIDKRYAHHPKLILLKRWIEHPRVYARVAEAGEEDLAELAVSMLMGPWQREAA